MLYCNCSCTFIDFIQFFIDLIYFFISFIQILSILYNSNITILQKTLFSPKKSPCGKMHTRQKKNVLLFFYFQEVNFHASQIFSKRFFLQKKKPLRENAHTAKYFFGRLEPSQDTGQRQVEDSM